MKVLEGLVGAKLFASTASWFVELWVLYRQISIIAVGDKKPLIILLRASIHQVKTCARKLHFVMQMNLR